MTAQFHSENAPWNLTQDPTTLFAYLLNITIYFQLFFVSSFPFFVYRFINSDELSLAVTSLHPPSLFSPHFFLFCSSILFCPFFPPFSSLSPLPPPSFITFYSTLFIRFIEFDGFLHLGKQSYIQGGTR